MQRVERDQTWSRSDLSEGPIFEGKKDDIYFKCKFFSFKNKITAFLNCWFQVTVSKELHKLSSVSAIYIFYCTENHIASQREVYNC